jgi:hypothetical protein
MNNKKLIKIADEFTKFLQILSETNWILNSKLILEPK